jgi:hypothetical protein
LVEILEKLENSVIDDNKKKVFKNIFLKDLQSFLAGAEKKCGAKIFLLLSHETHQKLT